MPPLVAAAAITAGASIGSNVIGAKMQSGAARRMADTQTTAANYAADKQEAASLRAEAFQRQMAQNAYQNDEAARRGNYDLLAATRRDEYDRYAATEGRRGSIGALLGMGPRNIPAYHMPAYVPGVDPGFEGGSGGVSGPMPVGAPPPQVRPMPPTSSPAPPASVGAMLQPGPDGTVIDRATGRVVRRPVTVAAGNRGTPGSVGSYLRSA